ncbi:MAG: hypothetical protein JSS76_01045 [Bacteroidetes bacterium]|nr:hypothetical protein [Bacteroidota bacterium]
MGKEMKSLELWQGPNGINLPATLKEANEVVPYANYLSENQKKQIVSAFQIQAYDMAAEYAWKKAMVKLKETIATLGMKFVGEMIGREDFDETTSVDTEVTDYTAIKIAEQLGVIGATAALKLRQSNELITHYFSKNADEELDYTSAFSIVKSSIQYVLGEQDISIAIEFSKFRDRLLNESLKLSDPQVEQVINSPLFYLRTVMTILLSSARNDVGAKLENSLANLNLIVPPIWPNLAEGDRWNIGTAYRDVTASGNTIAASGIKNALLKVGGFDYVPENLRSITFIRTAQQVIETHFAYNNFYNEPAVVSKLSSLGNTIPTPALIECFQAYLVVYLGNRYGISREAAPIAEKELSKISKERWRYYFEKVIQSDETILYKIISIGVTRFCTLLKQNGLDDFTGLPRTNQLLYDAILQNNSGKASTASQALFSKIKKGS